jgi:uncharacterized protein (TIGR02145 family)
MKNYGNLPVILPALAMMFLITVIGCKKNENETSEIKDGDGNVYTSITIGTQVWLKENLKTTSYSDGESIPLVTDNDEWGHLETQGYCWYNNEEITYKSKFGALYNWYVVNSGKICPTGWHVPSFDEWEDLTTFLGGELVAGGKLKEEGTTYWADQNTADNSSGFSARGGGYRDGNGFFGSILEQGYRWTATETNSSHAWAKFIGWSTVNTYKDEMYKDAGFSVRCIKN